MFAFTCKTIVQITGDEFDGSLHLVLSIFGQTEGNTQQVPRFSGNNF